MYTLIGILLGAAVWWWLRRTVVRRRSLVVGKELDLDTEGIPREIMLFGRRWRKTS